MHCFVYGTLTDESTASRLLDAYEFRGSATLVGLHRVDGQYPTLAPGGSVDGRSLTTTESESLDRYEGVDNGLYVRLSVPADGGLPADRVDVYVGDPDRLDAPVTWPGDGSFATRVRAFLREHDVRVVRDERS
jgi:gamma-glutamylcyclotransferase (GGCT)/AIG2-like uncharacterized protein YtfP